MADKLIFVIEALADVKASQFDLIKGWNASLDLLDGKNFDL